MDIRLTQEITFHVPRVVFLLYSVLVGVMITTFFSLTKGFKRYFSERKIRIDFQKETDDRIRGEQIFEKAENAFAAFRFDKAEKELLRLLSIQPNHVGALLHMGLIKQREGKNDGAMEYHLKAVEYAPDNVRVLYSLAEEYLEAGNSEKAMLFLKKIRDFDGTSLLPLYKIRDYYVEQEDWEKACSTQKTIIPLIKDKEELVKEQKLYGNIIYSKGMELYKNGLVAQSFGEFKKCMKEIPDFAMPYILSGDIKRDEGNEKTAVKIWKSGFMNARSYVCLDRIQKTYKGNDKVKKITKLYQDAIVSSDGKQKEDLILILGMCLLDHGDLEAAAQTLSVDFENSSLYRDIILAKVYDQREEKEEVKKMEEVIFNSAKDSIFELVGQPTDNGNQ